MARLTLILTVLTTVVALLGGFRLVMDMIHRWRWRRKVTGKWLAAVVLLTSLWSVPDANAAGRVFYDGFETGTTNAAPNAPWTLGEGFGNNDDCRVRTTSFDGNYGAAVGSKFLSCNWTGVADTGDGSCGPCTQQSSMLEDEWTYTGEVLFRFRMRVDTDLDCTGCENGPKVLRVGDTTNYPSTFLDAQDNITTGITGNFFNDSGGGVTPAAYWGGNDASDRTWHEIAFYVKAATGTAGIIRVFVDHVEVFETTGNTVTNWGWNKWIFGSNWSAGAGCCYHDANNHVYFDEFEIFSDTGTGATGLMADDTITQDGGGGEGGSSIILFLEWIPLIVGLIWHARTWLIGAALLIGGATMTTVSLAAQKTKQLSTTATISTLNIISSVLEKVKR